MKVRIMTDHPDGLCPTCKNATHARGRALSQRMTYCSEFGQHLRWPVVECSGYVTHGTLTLWQLSGMATIIEHEEDGRVGFRSMSKEERHDLERDCLDIK